MNDLTTKEKRLHKIITKAQKELRKIVDAREKREAKKLVGKFFKYRNCYSGAQTEKDYWWVYRAVTSIRGNFFIITEFQVDSAGNLSAELDAEKSFSTYQSWIEIAWDEYADACTDFKEKAKLL
jgi:hypothetical protein